MKRLILIALALFISACAAHPPTETEKYQAQVYLNQGIAWEKKGHFDQAISDYNKAIKINPRYAEPYNNRGIVYANKGKFNKAISDYNKAIEIDPRLGRAYKNRAGAYYSKGEYDKALDDVRKAQSLGLQVHPGFLKLLREASGRQE